MAVTSLGVPSGFISSTFGNEFNYVNLRSGISGLPQMVAIFATYDPTKTAITANEPLRVFSGTEAGEKLGFGFPAHLAARQTLKKSGAVPVYIFPIEEASGAVAGSGTILVVGTSTSSGTIYLYLGGQLITVTVATATTPANIATAIVAAITAEVSLPVTAAVNGTTPEQVDITSKYLGAIANDIDISVNITETQKDKTPDSVSFTITDMASGAGAPTVTDALNKFGDDWYTYVVNTFGTDTDIMAEFAAFNEDYQWDTQVNRFFRAYYGSVDSYSTITTITDALTLDKTNSVIPSTNAYCLPLELAALAVGQMAARNQDNPAQPYTGLTLDGLIPSLASSDQWTGTVMNAANLIGTSTTTVCDGVIELKDIVMHYHKTGEDPPAYRYAVNIAKLAQWAYGMKLIFEGDNWKGKILVDDTDVVDNVDARRPIDAIAAVYKLADANAKAAIITLPATTKANTTCSIDSENPDRFNIQTLIVLSGSARVKAATTNFGFNFGAFSA